ncbi:transposase [Hymenobacter nivis]|uniref:Transposase IS701-like DDE domain-containing protein n=1 Tax=Hymenobacter nivis TaxID=1850093 RepID=A0A2Z3GTF0_9BACT|nr:hypothetical protein DDQ68_07510 [Hymenobacter nivis]
MDERLPDSNYNALHHFISVSSWNGAAVMDEVARRVQASLALLGGEQGLLLDECSWEKVGHKSVGVARQYIGQVGVFAVLCRGIHAGLVGGYLYPPTAWSTDAARCAQARIPAAVQSYRSKPALAAELVKHLFGSGLAGTDWVGGDAACGNSPALRQTLEDRQQACVLDVGPGLGRPVPGGAARIGRDAKAPCNAKRCAYRSGAGSRSGNRPRPCSC